MKLKSTYSFLKTYFNYTTSGNRIYGRAVSEAMKVIRETMNEKTPLRKYNISKLQHILIEV